MSRNQALARIAIASNRTGWSLRLRVNKSGLPYSMFELLSKITILYTLSFYLYSKAKGSRIPNFEATIINSILSIRKSSLFLEKWPLTTTASTILLYFQTHYWWAGRNSIVFCCGSQYYCRGKRSVKTRLEKVALKKMAKKGQFINYVNMILRLFGPFSLRWQVDYYSVTFVYLQNAYQTMCLHDILGHNFLQIPQLKPT